MLQTGEIDETEFRWFTTNFAARDEVLQFRDEAFPNDETALAATTAVIQ